VIELWPAKPANSPSPPLTPLAPGDTLHRNMPEQPDSSASWADVVKELLDSFLLIRDIFGYALPGGLFLAIGIASGRLKLSQLAALTAPFHPPTWVWVGVAISASYLVGHILAAVAYLRIDIWKLFHWRDPDWYPNHPTELNPRDLYLRHYYPDLFHDQYRRETLSVLSFASVAALILGWLVFCEFQVALSDILISSGVLVFIDTLSTMSHLRRVREATHKAGELIEAQEKALADAQRPIQPSSEDLRYMIDAILKAAEIAAKKPPETPGK